MYDSATIVMGLLCSCMGLGFILFFLHHQRTGQPIHWQKGQSKHPKLAMSALHAMLMTFFFFGLGISLIGIGSGNDFGRWGIPIAVLSVLILIPMTVVQQSILTHRHKQELIAQGQLEPEKKTPIWVWLPILVLLGCSFYWLYQKTEERRTAMVGVVNEFVESVRAGDAESAWQFYTDEMKHKVPLEKFQRDPGRHAMANALGFRQTAFNEPYKMTDGVAEYMGQDAQGRDQHFSIVFVQLGNGLDKLMEPRFAVDRFSHDTPKITSGVKQFLQYLKSGEYKKARLMAYLHERDSEGKLLYTLDGKQLREHAEALGLLNARQLEFAYPIFEGDGEDIFQDILVTPVRGERYRIRMEISLDPRSSGTGNSVNILSIERVRT